MTNDSFTNQKSRIATEQDCIDEWSGGKNRFRCYLCGFKFEVGSVWRWVYATKIEYFNFLTCEKCDGDDILERWVKHNKELDQKFWWALER